MTAKEVAVKQKEERGRTEARVCVKLSGLQNFVEKCQFNKAVANSRYLQYLVQHFVYIVNGQIYKKMQKPGVV